jgi:hypothetical protein
MKKTLTPLNDVYTRRAQHLPRARDNAFNRHDVALIARAAKSQMQIVNVAKRSMK